MTNRQRSPDPAFPTESRVSAAVRTSVWLVRGTPCGKQDVIWLKRPMPDAQWPVDQRLPRDDSFSWWVRSSCGHQGGARQWAFYQEADADLYGLMFRDNPCWFTRCPDFKIENEQRIARG